MSRVYKSLSEWMLTILSGRLGRLVLGDTSPPSPMQEAPREGAAASAKMQAASSSSAGMGERSSSQPADGLQSKFAPPVYGGSSSGKAATT